MEEAQETERPAAVPVAEETAGGEQPATDQQKKKQIYLRTIYPLNPGIPHFVDVPQGW